MLNKITDNVEIHQTLPDTPNLTTQELKKEWDKGPKILKEAFNNLIDELNNNMFPIGYRMFINNDKDYSNHLGFTWEKVAKGRVLIGKDENDADFNTVGKVGGEKEHVLTIAEMPTHSHPADGTKGLILASNAYASYAQSGVIDTTGAGLDWDTQIAPQGGNQAHNNLQPYEVVNIWERIL